MRLTPILRRAFDPHRVSRAHPLVALLRWLVVGALCAWLAGTLLLGQEAYAQAQAPAAPAAAPAEAPAPAAPAKPAPEAGAAQDTPEAPSRPLAINRLKIGTLVEFDTRHGTVRDALHYLLEPTHYRLTTDTVDAAYSAEVLRRPLPKIVHKAGVMSIEAAALLLIGEENRLVVDHTDRLIAIERMPADDTQAAFAHP
ncbi:hypothetical protein M8A51_22990 [Schlegelella sp. S2-27]|uniref:Uncharacterized protein n=1 Tax=Caldimonas mangrovi TaxID=2944811 RepID=A0ABT0YUH5_9BURK|nr:hypothetical protein [Caldimonas mangrovi]MCM5682404.1 hypothetical protein [Caldimonas mangrovi]